MLPVQAMLAPVRWPRILRRIAETHVSVGHCDCGEIPWGVSIRRFFSYKRYAESDAWHACERQA
jgi:hypothetical protein